MMNMIEIKLKINKEFVIIGTQKYGQELFENIENEIIYSKDNKYKIIFPDTVKMIAISGIVGFFKKPILNGNLDFFMTNVEFEAVEYVKNEIKRYLKDNIIINNELAKEIEKFTKNNLHMLNTNEEKFTEFFVEEEDDVVIINFGYGCDKEMYYLVIDENKNLINNYIQYTKSDFISLLKNIIKFCEKLKGEVCLKN